RGRPCSRRAIATRQAGLSQVQTGPQKQLKRSGPTSRRSKRTVTAQISRATGNSSSELTTRKAQKQAESTRRRTTARPLPLRRDPVEVARAIRVARDARPQRDGTPVG